MHYQHFGVMIDCSRNGVMKPSQVKKLIDCLQRMGYNTLELYTEDTYEVQDEPYFGYLRGGYTRAELKDLDAYARAHGIELIPCIQTLAHFTSLVKLPHYFDIVDNKDILLVDEEKTYRLIENIFRTLADTFTSRNVNIGMDEAHTVGLGKYLDEHGYKPQYELLLRHLDRVVEIARKYGFHCQMWSDMFFRLINHGEYYGKDLHLPEEVRRSVPEDVALAYWDYYHRNVEMYDEMMRAHAELGREIWFAGGAWTWCGFAPLNERALVTMKPAMQSVIANQVKNVLITLWGDNGKECSYFSALATLYAIRRYADGQWDEQAIKQEFFELFGVKYDDFMLLSLPNYPNATRADGQIVENPAKSLLYSDCFMGIFDDLVKELSPIDYREYSKKLVSAGRRAKEWGYIFRNLASLCDVMELKYDLGVRTRQAYAAGDLEVLEGLIGDYRKTEARLKKFIASFRAQWLRENKPFGLEIQEARLGGLLLRISSCRQRISEYVEGTIDCIEELETPILPYGSDGHLYENEYQKLISTSNL